MRGLLLGCLVAVALLVGASGARASHLPCEPTEQVYGATDLCLTERHPPGDPPGDPRLPFTGFEAGLVGFVGFALVVTGVALRRSTRRRLPDG